MAVNDEKILILFCQISTYEKQWTSAASLRELLGPELAVLFLEAGRNDDLDDAQQSNISDYEKVESHLRNIGVVEPYFSYLLVLV